MRFQASTWRNSIAVHCAWLLAPALALAAGCSLDDRSVKERESDVSMTDESDGSASENSGGAAAGGSRVEPHQPRSGASGAGTGGGGGEGAAAGELQPPQGGDAGETGDVDDDGGLPDAGPDGAPDTGVPCTAGNALRPEQGWVDESTNCVGIQGGVRVDWANESYVLVSIDTGAICAEGYSNEAVPSPFDSVFVLNLNEDLRAGGTASDYNAPAHGVVGFEFVVEPPSPQPYFGVISDNVLYCTRITTPGTYRVALTDLHAACWNGSSGPTPNAERLRSIGFYSGATVEDSGSYQFCVSDIVALTSLD